MSATQGKAILMALALGARPCLSAIIVGSWQPIYRGVAYATGSADAGEPRLQQVRAIRIDLQDASVELLATPSNGSASKDTTTSKTSSFLKNNALQVAINAGFFDYSVNAAVGADISGLQISRGALVSEAASDFGNCILRITTNNVAALVDARPLPYDTAGIYTAVPGSHFILVNGVPNSDTTVADPRSLAGISADGRFLVLATIDGRQTGYSEGATYKECGEWLLRFGCHKGLNLDGGGSTTLVRSDGAGGATILNRPSGSERFVGSHLGVFAQSVPPPVTVAFDAQGGVVTPASTTVTNGLTYGSLPLPTRASYTFSGWWTVAAGAGTAVTATTVVGGATNHTLYARWVGTASLATLDAQGGTVNPSSLTVTNGLAYGTLPVPTRADYTFGGWWTGTGGNGTQVTSVTVVTATANHSLFARWDAVVYGAAANTLPYRMTFEPPDLQAGDSLIVSWNTNGWYGDGIAIITNLPYAWLPAGHPVPTAIHSNVLAYAEASLTNLFARVDGINHTVVDLMLRPEDYTDERPDPALLLGAQASFFIDAAGHFNVLCSGDQNHTNRLWVTFANTPVPAHNWARLTLAFDYASDTVHGLAYYRVALDGVPLSVPGGAGYAYGNGGFTRSLEGCWLVSANPVERQVNRITFDGSAYLDDVVVTTDELAFLPYPPSRRTLLFIR